MQRQTEIIDCVPKITEAGMEYLYVLTDAEVRVEVGEEAAVFHAFFFNPSRRTIRELRGEIRDHIIPFLEEIFNFDCGYIATWNHKFVRLMCSNKEEYEGECNYGPVYKIHFKDV